MILGEKDPSEILDYQINWIDVLVADTISTSTWTVPSGMTKVSESNTTTTVTVWVSGGTAGRDYTWTNTITTAGGRTWERSFVIPVRGQ